MWINIVVNFSFFDVFQNFIFVTENIFYIRHTSFIAYNNENENIELKTSKSVPKDKIQIKVRYDADNVKDIHIDKNLYNDDEYIGDDIYIDDD